jgi:hypothetical protein
LPWITPDRLPWEAWYLHFVDRQNVGYSHVMVASSAINPETHLSIQRIDTLELETGSPVRRSSEASELLDGRLVSFLSKTIQGQEEIVVEGQISRSELVLKTKADGKTTLARTPWEEGTWGVMGVQASLIQQPLQSGETRTCQIFLPELNVTAAATLAAGSPAFTPIPPGKTRELLPVDVQLTTQDLSLSSRHWIDEHGEILKTVSLSGPQLSVFRVSAELAAVTRDKFEVARFLTAAAAFKSVQPLAVAGRSRYLIELDYSYGTPLNLLERISSNVSQTVISKGAYSLEVTVYPVPLQGDLPAGLSHQQPTNNDRQPTPIIQSSFPTIENLARELAAGTEEPSQLAQQLTAGVHAKLTRTPFTRDFLSAVDTLQRGQGDSTEYAVLLTALLRNRGIPARVASGIQVDPKEPGKMVFHAWTEAWIVDRWIPLDATQEEPVALDRIKLRDSALSSENPYELVLPVLELLDSLTVTRLASLE